MPQKFIMAVQVTPLMEQGKGFYVIDKAIEAIQKSGTKYRVSPCETVIEGTSDQLMAVLESTQQACFEAGAENILVNVKIERSRDKDMTIEKATGKFETNH